MKSLILVASLLVLAGCNGNVVFNSPGGSFSVLPTPQPQIIQSSFLGADTKTEGNWIGAYGKDGNAVALETASLPSYASVSESSNTLTYMWSVNTLNVPALQLVLPDSAPRKASCFYNSGAFSLAINLTDGQQHQVALYLVDFDHQSRAETVTLSDINGNVLDTRIVSNYSRGG